MDSITPIYPHCSPEPTEQSWVDVCRSKASQGFRTIPIQHVEPVDEEYESHTTTYRQQTIFRREIIPTLRYAKEICMHLHRLLSIIEEYGEDALSTASPSASQLDLDALLRGDIEPETDLQIAQHRFATYHTAVSECLKGVEIECGLPVYLSFSRTRNWFCHDYCTPDAETNGRGMWWAVEFQKREYEDLLPQVVKAISELTALSNDAETWKPMDRSPKCVTCTVVKEEEDIGVDSGHNDDSDSPAVESALDSGHEVYDAQPSIETATPASRYHKYDDGFLTYPLRALYFRSQLYRTMMDAMGDFWWNRKLEFCEFHDIDPLEKKAWSDR